MIEKIKILYFLCSFGTFIFADEAKCRLSVKDVDTGVPITNATVKAIFHYRKQIFWGGSEKVKCVEKETDSTGCSTVNAKGDFNYVFFRVTAPGYYEGYGDRVSFTNKSGFVFKKLEPWNERRTLTLQKIGKQVPMYYKDMRRGVFPLNVSSWGLDLIKGDWMPPHGKGEVADIIFSRKKEIFGGYEINTFRGKLKIPFYYIELKMLFPGEGNGVVPIIKEDRYLHQLREAPFDNYQNSYVWFEEYRERGKTSGNKDIDNLCFYFRIRTEKNDKGEIVKSLYGVMRDFGTLNSFENFSFDYLINPMPNDRNLEADDEKIIFIGGLQF